MLKHAPNLTLKILKVHHLLTCLFGLPSSCQVAITHSVVPGKLCFGVPFKVVKMRGKIHNFKFCENARKCEYRELIFSLFFDQLILELGRNSAGISLCGFDLLKNETSFSVSDSCSCDGLKKSQIKKASTLPCAFQISKKSPKQCGQKCFECHFFAESAGEILSHVRIAYPTRVCQVVEKNLPSKLPSCHCSLFEKLKPVLKVICGVEAFSGIVAASLHLFLHEYHLFL